MMRQRCGGHGRDMRAMALPMLLLACVATPAPAQFLGIGKKQQPATPPVQIMDSAAVMAKPDPENTLLLDLSTGGRVTIRLRPDAAPSHVERIKTLTRQGFYDGLLFHRVIEGFMAQTGDPKGTGEGGSEFPDLKAEFNELPHVRGAVSMARTEDEDSANSQFFIMFTPLLRLDRTYTVFGRVVDGMGHVDRIARGEPPPNPDRIIQASIAADNKPLPNFPVAAAVASDPVAAEAAKMLQAQPQ